MPGGEPKDHGICARNDIPSEIAVERAQFALIRLLASADNLNVQSALVVPRSSDLIGATKDLGSSHAKSAA
jgi:hypothetical protein